MKPEPKKLGIRQYYDIGKKFQEIERLRQEIKFELCKNYGSSPKQNSNVCRAMHQLDNLWSALAKFEMWLRLQMFSEYYGSIPSNWKYSIDILECIFDPAEDSRQVEFERKALEETMQEIERREKS